MFFFSHPHKPTSSKHQVICTMSKASPKWNCFPVPCSLLTVKSCSTEYRSLWDLNHVCGSRKRPDAYQTWNRYLKEELGRYKVFVISVCSLCSEGPQMCTHFCCSPAWHCSRPPQKCSVLFMTQAGPDTSLSQGGSGSFVCVCVKEGVIILLA